MIVLPRILLLLSLYVPSFSIDTAEADYYGAQSYAAEKPVHKTNYFTGFADDKNDATDASITSHQAITVFMNTYKYLDNTNKHEFIHKIGDIIIGEEGPSPPPQQQRGLRRGQRSDDIATIDADLMHSRALGASPGAAGAAMELAIESSEKAIKYLQDLTTDIIQSASKAKQEIAEWASKITDLTDEALNEYIEKVAVATITLNNASVEARNMMQDMLDLVTLAIDDMQLYIDDDDAFKESVLNAQIVMEVQLEVTAVRLGELEVKVQQAQNDFQVAADKSAYFSNVISDNLNNKDGYIDKKADSLRAKAYGGCAACVVFPISCVVCYGTAAGIVETQINEMKEDLKSTKNALTSIKGTFDSLKIQCTDLATAAANEYENMNTVKTKLVSTQTLVVKTEKLIFWKRIVLPRLTNLQSALQNALL